MLRIMLVDDTPDRSYYLRLVLEKLGHEVVAEMTDGREMHDAVLKLSPDVIIVETESPSRDTLENLCFVTDTCPRPIVMFTQDRDRDRIREAISSGVTAYIVDGLSPERLNPIIDTAVARFDAYQAMKDELKEAKSRLSERKLVDKAKGLVMKQRGMSEDTAYRALRKMAMDQSVSMAEISRRVIAIADLLV